MALPSAEPATDQEDTMNENVGEKYGSSGMNTIASQCRSTAGQIKPVVAERILLAEAARAHELLERGEYAGKVVLITSAYPGSLDTGR